MDGKGSMLTASFLTYLSQCNIRLHTEWVGKTLTSQMIGIFEISLGSIPLAVL